MSTWYIFLSKDDLVHHGVKGMKWGVRNQVYKPSAGSRKRGYSGPSNSAYSSHKSGSSSSNIKKSGTSQAPLNAAGGATLAGGASLKDMEEMQALYDKLNSGKSLTEAELAVFLRVLSAMEKGNKQAYEKFLNDNPKIYKAIQNKSSNNIGGGTTGSWNKVGSQQANSQQMGLTRYKDGNSRMSDNLTDTIRRRARGI